MFYSCCFKKRKDIPLLTLRIIEHLELTTEQS